MALLLHADSFEFYNPATTANGMYTSASMSAATGRFPIPSGSLGSGINGSGTLFIQERNKAVVGVAWNTPLLYYSPIGFSNSMSGFQFSVAGVGDGRFYVQAQLSGSATTSDCSTKSISANLWYFYELSLTTVVHHQPYVPATAGPPPTASIPEQWWITCTYEFRVNGETWLSGFIDTPHRLGNGVWDIHLNIASVQLSASPGTMSDLYITDGDFLGDNAVKVLYPAGDSATDFTPRTGTDHYAMVNEHQASSTNYNTADTAGQEDSYTLDTLPAFTGVISGTSAVWYVANSDGGSSSFVGWYGSDTETTQTFYPNIGYRLFEDCQLVNPNTGVAWTQSDINSLVLGITRTL